MKEPLLSSLVDENSFLRYNFVAGTLHFAEVAQEDFISRMAVPCQRYYRNTPCLRDTRLYTRTPAEFFLCMFASNTLFRVNFANDSYLVKREEVRET